MPVMYFLLITFLTQSESIVVPSAEKAYEVIDYLRTNYKQLLVKALESRENLEVLTVDLFDGENTLIDRITFRSIFGQADYEGVKSIIAKKLALSNPLPDLSE